MLYMSRQVQKELMRDKNKLDIMEIFKNVVFLHLSSQFDRGFIQEYQCKKIDTFNNNFRYERTLCYELLVYIINLSCKNTFSKKL